jgi:hypothetical protein
MRALAVAVCCFLAVSAMGQGLFGSSQSQSVSAPRVTLPSAQLLGNGGSAASYTYRGATYKGRDMENSQFTAAVGLTKNIDLGWDYNDIGVNGRTAGNTFDVHATGWQLRYGQELLNAPGALFAEYRTSDGRVVTNEATRIPPGATTITLGAVRSSTWSKRDDLHLTGSLSRCKVGSENAWSWMGGIGVDHKLTDSLTARGDLALFKETGDIDGFEAGISGGVHYAVKGGLSADVMGTFLPSGTPLAGNSLADGSVFILDPVFRTEPIVRDLQNGSLAFYTIRVGYTTTF